MLPVVQGSSSPAGPGVASRKGFPSVNAGVFLRLFKDPQLLSVKAAGHQGQGGQSLAT